MNYKKYILHCYTNWCGEENDYAIIAKEGEDLSGICDNAAYTNFFDFDGPEAVLRELFPDVEDEEYTEEQINEANEAEDSYFGYNLNEFEGTDEEWDWYELIYNASQGK